MTPTELFQHIALTSLVCVGLRIVSSKINGDPMILYFLRWPYEQLIVIEKDYRTVFTEVLIYILKPIIGCVYCMASFHTLTTWHLLHGSSIFTWSMVPFMVINMLSTSAVNGIVYNTFEFMLKKIQHYKSMEGK